MHWPRRSGGGPGGAIGLIEDGDTIDIDLHQRSLNLWVEGRPVSAGWFEERRRVGGFTAPQRNYGPLLGFYSRTVGPTAAGAVLGAGLPEEEGR
ncbi:MAG: hypothetical protein GKR89_17890 [Candidatus Latescibacteria bacterium]|nr:hypothetical protein [Candidatus Latescibacterota bacterium]